MTAFTLAAPNLVPDVTSWTIVASGMSAAVDKFWGLALQGNPSIATGAEHVLAQSPAIPVGVAAAYCASADLICYGSSGSYVYLDFVTQGADGANAQAPANTNFDDTRARSTFSSVATTASNDTSAIMRLVGYIPSGGSVTVMGLRKPKFEKGSTPTAYTQEGQTGSLSSTVSILSATTSNLNSRVNTAVFQVTAQAGNSRGLFKISADGYGQSSIDLVAGTFNVWSQNGANAVQALAIDASGNARFYGKLAASAIDAGTITADRFLTNAGVDLAAIVPGQFNWNTLGSAPGVSQVLAPGAAYGPFCGTGLETLNGHTLNVTVGYNIAGGSPGTGTEPTPKTVYADIYLGVHPAGGGWYYYLIGSIAHQSATGGALIATNTFGSQITQSGPNMQFGLYVVCDSQSQGNLSLQGTWTINVQGLFNK